MDAEIINELVDVGAVFGKNAIKPKWFIWEGRKYAITEAAYTWRDKVGTAVIIHFSVTDGSTQFELSYNQSTMNWTLERSAIV